MKKTLLTLLAIATIATSTFAQAPEGFKYQAVIRDGSSLILNNQAVGIQLMIRQGSAGGAAVYTETFSPTTNGYGLVNLEIGTGTTTDDFTTIDWANGPYFIETAVDITGGVAYLVMGTNQLMSVPYALYAKTAENVTNDLVDDADADPNNEIQAVSFSNDTLYLSNGGQVYLGAYGIDLVDDADADPTNEMNTGVVLNGTNLEVTDANSTIITDLSSLQDGVDDADADPNNEIQAVSFSNDTLYLSNGGQVYLGAYGIDLVDDADADPTNEMNTGVVLNGTNLEVTDANSTIITDLSSLQDGVDDADADPNNELQAVSLLNDTLYLTNGGQVYLGAIGSDTLSFIQDIDGDTKIQTEESADEDIIRFDLGGTEHFVMNGPRLGVYNSGESVFIGEGAGVADDLSLNGNVGIGYSALYSNTYGNKNTASGYQALYRNTGGSNNSAFGYRALYSNTTGSNNSAFGYRALYSNTTGRYNVASGYFTLYDNTTGDHNTAFGYYALYSNTIGTYNMASGYQALYDNTSGSYNVAIGYQALRGNDTGDHNTAIGYQALNWTDPGSYNTAIGYDADINSGPYIESTALGFQATITASNQVRIGDNGTLSIGGYQNWSNVSDGRFKTNVKENVSGLDFILKLRPVTYNLDRQKINQFLRPDAESVANSSVVQSGFIAQEVEALVKELGFGFHGVDAPKNDKDHYGLRYAEFVVPLVKATQEQQIIITKLEERIRLLEIQLQKKD